MKFERPPPSSKLRVRGLTPPGFPKPPVRSREFGDLLANGVSHLAGANCGWIGSVRLEIVSDVFPFGDDTRNRGFESITFNVNVTDFVTQ